MEILAVLASLETLTRPCRVRIYSDSRYVVDAINKKVSLIDRIPPRHWSTAVDGCATYDNEGKVIADSQCGGGFTEHLKLAQESFEKLSTEGKVWTTPMADSFAAYLIISLRPLVMAHIPYMDAWHAAASTLRGLRPYEVEAELERQARIRDLFKARQRKQQ